MVAWGHAVKQHRSAPELRGTHTRSSGESPSFVLAGSEPHEGVASAAVPWGLPRSRRAFCEPQCPGSGDGESLPVIRGVELRIARRGTGENRDPWSISPADGRCQRRSELVRTGVRSLASWSKPSVGPEPLHTPGRHVSERAATACESGDGSTPQKVATAIKPPTGQLRSGEAAEMTDSKASRQQAQRRGRLSVRTALTRPGLPRGWIDLFGENGFMERRRIWGRGISSFSFGFVTWFDLGRSGGSRQTVRNCRKSGSACRLHVPPEPLYVPGPPGIGGCADSPIGRWRQGFSPAEALGGSASEPSRDIEN